jgi:hypothetical protein
MRGAAFFSVLWLLAAQAGWAAPKAPYPPSQVFRSITWHWETHTTAALGSDLWPVTWGADDQLYAAWGDGGGFGGSDTDGRVALLCPDRRHPGTLARH